MSYYPINLNITGQPCLVVGGGAVGSRKVKGLLDCDAQVTVVSKKADVAILNLAQARRIRFHCRGYRSQDVEAVFLVIGATNDATLNRQIYADAQKNKILCNIADQPALCNFILPAVVRRGDLLITASTSGRSPALAKKLRKELAATYGEEYAEFLTLMGAIRKKLLATEHAPEAHKPLFNALIDGGLIGMVRDGRHREIDELLTRVLGPEYHMQSITGNIGSITV